MAGTSNSSTCGHLVMSFSVTSSLHCVFAFAQLVILQSFRESGVFGGYQYLNGVEVGSSSE